MLNVKQIMYGLYWEFLYFKYVIQHLHHDNSTFIYMFSYFIIFCHVKGFFKIKCHFSSTAPHSGQSMSLSNRGKHFQIHFHSKNNN